MPTDNSTLGEQPKPCRMEPPPVASSIHNPATSPRPNAGEKKKNMGTSHTERDSVEADKIRLKPNNNSQNSNKENHQNQGMTKIIIIIIMGGTGRDGERKRIQTRPYNAPLTTH